MRFQNIRTIPYRLKSLYGISSTSIRLTIQIKCCQDHPTEGYIIVLSIAQHVRASVHVIFDTQSRVRRLDGVHFCLCSESVDVAVFPDVDSPPFSDAFAVDPDKTSECSETR